MSKPHNPIRGPGFKEPGFFAIFPILARLLWRYGRKLFSVETLVALEKKHGAGSGERTVEEDLLDQALQRNKHHYHVTGAHLHPHAVKAERDSALRNPVLVVKKGDGDERNG